MTITEFLQELAYHVPHKAWALSDGRTLRATHRNIAGEFCPLTALCYWQHNEHFTVNEWYEAADYLGMERCDAAAIIDAADKRGEYQVMLRTDLLCNTLYRQ